jgi:hypothetical protein
MVYALGMLALCASWLLTGHYFPWAAFQQDALAAIGAALVALAAIVSADVHRLVVPRFAWVVMALAAVPMLQWLAGMTPFLGDALLCTMFLLAFGMCIVASRALAVAHRDDWLLALVLAMLGGAVASTGIGLAQWLHVDHWLIEYLPPGGRVYANITQPNSLASLLALGIVSFLWLFERRQIGHTVAIVGVTFLGYGMVMTQSRTGWLFVAGFAMWIGLMQRRVALRTGWPAVATAVALFIGASLLWQPLNAALGMGLEVSTAQRISSAGTRPGNWLNLLDAVAREPWPGWGWMQVSVAQQATLLDHPPQHEWLTYSHNLPIDLLVWNGIPLGLALCGAGAWWLASRIHACGNIDCWAMLAGIGALLVHAMLEYPLAYAYFLFPLGMMIGVVEAQHASTVGSSSAQGSAISRVPFSALLTASLAVFAWVWVEYLDIEDEARRQRLKEAGYVVDGQAASVPKVVLLDHQRDFLRFRMDPAREGMAESDLDRMRNVSQRFAPPAAMLRYALAAGLNGREAEAERTLRLLCHMWSIVNCNEGREAWLSAQAKYPKLKTVAYPASTEAAGRPLAAHSD